MRTATIKLTAHAAAATLTVWFIYGYLNAVGWAEPLARLLTLALEGR